VPWNINATGKVNNKSIFKYHNFTFLGHKWILNGITTGSGKSAVISLLAHLLSDMEEIEEVWVVTIN
jgi:hypothetical protein